MYHQGGGYPPAAGGGQYPPNSNNPYGYASMPAATNYAHATVAPVEQGYGFGSLGGAYDGYADPNNSAYYVGANPVQSNAAAASYYGHVNAQGYGYASYAGPSTAAPAGTAMSGQKTGVLMGPVLLFRGVGYSDGSYNVAALIATTASHPPTLTVTTPYNAPVSCECLKSVRWKEKDINYGYISKDKRKMNSIKQDQFAYLWCYEWGIRQTEAAQVVRYSVSEWPNEGFWYVSSL